MDPREDTATIWNTRYLVSADPYSAHSKASHRNNLLCGVLETVTEGDHFDIFFAMVTYSSTHATTIATEQPRGGCRATDIPSYGAIGGTERHPQGSQDFGAPDTDTAHILVQRADFEQCSLPIDRFFCFSQGER